MSKHLSLQDMLIRLQSFWAEQNCIIWQPHNVQVGAGTMNPATFLRVLGPEPWNVAYVEPSVRPADGRYGENPNRMQYYYQYQVILKPDPGNPQELYLQSLEALGIDRREHDIRFVEDNWESPALGAWGLGWEVWLDGQEITQFTYFQQAGGLNLNPTSVEITYGVERILIALQGVDAVWNIEWNQGLSYADVLLQSEIEHCHYYFNVADVEHLRETYNVYEQEAYKALDYDPVLVRPAHDYTLKMSHLFNVLDARGAIGVVERAEFFKRMQRVAAKVARAYVQKRADLGYPMLPDGWSVDEETHELTIDAPLETLMVEPSGMPPEEASTLIFEIGCEELPAADVDSAIAQLERIAPKLLADARLDYTNLAVGATPRRLTLIIEQLEAKQRAEERIERGPPARIAFGEDGTPTKAAEGFARSQGVDVTQLEVQEIDGGEYVVAHIHDAGEVAVDILPDLLTNLVAAIRFEKAMRWNASGIAFSRPLRWLVALYGDYVVPVTYADVYSGRDTRGLRPLGSPEIELESADSYASTLRENGILLDRAARRETISQQIEALAAEAGGVILDDPGLLDEVTNLVEEPTAFLGTFSEDYLTLPAVVLTTVMRKHQRYFSVVDADGSLLPVFIAVRNGDDQHLASVRHGNEQVIRARFADARFFYAEDIKQPLADYIPDLKLLTFQEDLGSYFEKTERLEQLAASLTPALGVSGNDAEALKRAAKLAKADLATQMVVEMTSLQGSMGATYAAQSGEQEVVAEAIQQHYLPRYAGDLIPASEVGTALALIDRLDSLVGLFAVGLEPSGSADPYALRRAAAGVVQMLLGNQMYVDLREIIRITATVQPAEVSIDIQEKILTFLAGRLEGLLRDVYAFDVVQAVLNEVAYNPTKAEMHAQQLTHWVNKENWASLLDAFARCARITRNQKQTYTIKPEAFEAKAEKDLYHAYQTALTALDDTPSLDDMLSAFEPLVPYIETFFAPADEGGVLVMADDLAVRENRLALLQHIVRLSEDIADFSTLEGF